MKTTGRSLALVAALSLFALSAGAVEVWVSAAGRADGDGIGESPMAFGEAMTAVSAMLKNSIKDERAIRPDDFVDYNRLDLLFVFFGLSPFCDSRTLKAGRAVR